MYDVRDVTTGQTGSVRGASRIAQNITHEPYFKFDSSVAPIWFDTHGIRFYDFWISRIEWMGQIFHMTHIRGAVHVIRNIVENRPKSHPIGMLSV